MVTGHAHPSYAEAFAEFGRPRELSQCGGWVLERDVPGTSYRDAMGCYPLFACRDWAGLKEDVDALTGDLVSLAMVPDPFGAYQIEDLERTFDFVQPFKEHVVVDLSDSWEKRIIRHHRRKCKRAFGEMEVKRCTDPQEYLDDWVVLYDHLIGKHEIKDMRTFSRFSLSRQLDIPGASFFVALREGHVIGGLLTYERGDVACAQLTACDDEGYELGASYALHLVAMRHYAGRLRWFNLTGVPGLDDKGGGGLRWFKGGWSGQVRQTHFCGRILNRRVYDTLAAAHGVSADGYFPAYRAGEFS